MKQFMKFFAVAGIVCAMQSGCTKADAVGTTGPGTTDSNVTETPKDTIVTGATWFGGMILPGNGGEYYAVHFNADSTLIWSELSGDYDGTWSLSNKRITIDLPIHNVKIAADVSDGHTFNNITCDNPGFAVFACERMQNEEVQVSGTSWQGHISTEDAHTRTPIALQFIDDSKVQIITDDDASGGEVDYTGSKATRSFRFRFQDKVIFGTFVNRSHIEGMQDNANHLLSADKM